MKKMSALLFFLLTLFMGFNASAAGLVPPTGEPVSYTPYILAGVSLVLIAALIVLTYLSKKNKK
ncbi:MAG: hypothetical protein PHR24_05020 [Oscillospiraceae bacterium]|nr:hypothetical protein [Oscillospiraceae bacterium]MDD4546637.1 hypothetical protein [Oscillospiraceae bacterium]